VGPPWRGAAGRTRQVTLCGELTDLLSNPARALAISRAPRRKNKEGAVTKRRPRADMDNDVVASFGSRYPMSALGRINAGNAQTAGSGLDRSAAGPPSLSFPVRPGRDRGMRLPRAAPAGLCLSLAGPLGSHKLKHRRRRHGRGGVRRVADRVVQRRRGGDAPGLYAAEQQLQPAHRSEPRFKSKQIFTTRIHIHLLGHLAYIRATIRQGHLACLKWHAVCGHTATICRRH